jgi:regulator of sigma E protease
MSFFVGVLGLAFLILIHEAGHFFTAVALNMRPRKFYVGFPPAIAKVRRGGIEYGIGAIPLGGYVKIPGMHRPAPADLELHTQRALKEAPELLGPLERVKKALQRTDWEGARDGLPELEGQARAAQLSQSAQAGLDRGLDELRDGLSNDAYWRAAPWKRVLVIFAGPGTNLVFAIVLFAALLMTGGGKATTTVGQVVDETPAASMGLQAGDRILSINGQPVAADEVSARITGSDGKPLTLRVERNNRVVVLGPARAKKTSGKYRLGFVLEGEGLSPPAAAKESVELTGRVSKEIVTSLGNLVHEEGRDQISSPVGIVEGSSTAVRQGSQTYLWVLGLISLSLALLNLLPLLPLDGGHIFFSLLEWLRGRAVPREIYERVSAVGIALVLMLFFIGLSNDVGRIGGG